LREPERPAALGPEPRIPEFVELPRGAQPLRDEPLRQAWRRPAMVMAALVGGVGLIGAWAGSVAGSDAQQDEQVTVAVPTAKPQPRAERAPAPAMEAEARRDAPLAFATLRTQRPRPVRKAVAAEDRLAEVGQALATGEEASADAAGVEAPTDAAPAVAATMPLSNGTIARTIGRIGYACGEVASTSAVEGASGVFKVPCTSGHSYTAKQAHGRSRVRRLN